MVTGNDLERSIGRAIQETTPDMLDTLMAELGLETKGSSQGQIPLAQTEPVRIEDRRGRRKRRGGFGMAAAIAAIFALFIGVRMMKPDKPRTYAVVGIDVNPSIEIDVDQEERVIHAEGLNTEGKDILSDMNLDKTDLNVACNAILGKLLKAGYLSDTSNSVLVSVQAKDGKAGRQLEENISKEIDDCLDNYRITAAILGQYVEGNQELDTFAKDHGISVGKALLTRKILATGGQRMTEDSLLKLSTQELILLAQERQASRETNIGKADKTGYISSEKAEDAALAEFGIAREKAAGLNVELDCDDGLLIYEVEFSSGGSKYEADVEAKSGKILSREIEEDDDARVPDRKTRSTEAKDPEVEESDNDDNDEDDGEDDERDESDDDDD